jgi:hypothetical protein
MLSTDGLSSAGHLYGVGVFTNQLPSQPIILESLTTWSIISNRPATRPAPGIVRRFGWCRLRQRLACSPPQLRLTVQQEPPALAQKQFVPFRRVHQRSDPKSRSPLNGRPCGAPRRGLARPPKCPGPACVLCSECHGWPPTRPEPPVVAAPSAVTTRDEQRYAAGGNRAG